jgi:hypothetical protein
VRLRIAGAEAVAQPIRAAYHVVIQTTVIVAAAWWVAAG